MLIGVPTEIAPGERRVALVPETVSRLLKAGASVLVQRGAGERAAYRDPAYEEAGAALAADAAELYGRADTIV
jgi:NAD(P) transhydrogenase subunit alpha